MAWSTLDARADAVVAEGVASREEVNQALDELERFTRDPMTIIIGPRVSSSSQDVPDGAGSETCRDALAAVIVRGAVVAGVEADDGCTEPAPPGPR